MQKAKQSILKGQFQTLLPPIKHCKICFNEIKIDDFCRLFDQNICLCRSCQKLLEPKLIFFNVDQYKAVSLYDYSEFIKKQIYLFKGCFDYEMKEIFLNLFIKELNIYFKGYKIVPVPSYKKDDELRGFNHVMEVFKQMGLDILPIVEKTEHFKQADKSAKERQSINKYLRLMSTKQLTKDRILIVDDIYTTGSTMRAVINLVEKLHPKEIKILVLAKTKNKEGKKSNTKQSLH